MPPTAGVDDRPTCPHTPLMELARRSRTPSTRTEGGSCCLYADSAASRRDHSSVRHVASGCSSLLPPSTPNSLDPTPRFVPGAPSQSETLGGSVSPKAPPAASRVRDGCQTRRCDLQHHGSDPPARDQRGICQGG